MKYFQINKDKAGHDAPADRKFNNKDGSLTVYALSCGYIEQVDKESNQTRVVLWKECGGYHVRVHQFNGAGRIAWETFITLKEARKYFKEQVKACAELEDFKDEKKEQEELTEKAKTIIREGVILETFERENDKGFVTGRFVKWQGDEWFIRMMNGVVTKVRKLNT